MAEKAAFSITITKLNPATLTVSLRKDIGPFDAYSDLFFKKDYQTGEYIK